MEHEITPFSAPTQLVLIANAGRPWLDCLRPLPRIISRVSAEETHRVPLPKQLGNRRLADHAGSPCDQDFQRGTPVLDFTRTLRQLLRKSGDGGPRVADALALQLV